MNPENTMNQVSRRQVVQGIGAVGVGTLVASIARADEPAKTTTDAKDLANEVKLLPTRKLGRNGPMVPMLAMGGDMEATSAPGLINRAWASGMRYYDTAQRYGRAHEEEIYRKWLAAHPERRKEIFLVSKDYPTQKGPEQLLEMIDVRLKALGTDYLDLYFIHQLCPEIYGPESVNWGKSDVFRKVAEKLKASGKVKMVGFSCHGGPEYIQAAADGGFLDALMVQYTPFYERGGAFDKALTDCHSKGIGLIAMKTLRHAGNVPKRLPEFEKLGLTTHQTILQAVWSDPRISSICNSVRNFDQMKSSIACVHGYKGPLEVSVLDSLKEAVLASRRTMCPGCPSCDSKVASTSFAFRDVARYVTYFEQDNFSQSRDRYLALPEAARTVSNTDLQALSQGCSFGVDYAEVADRAQRYFA
ncbi:MAG: aldo/keto reductase [Planctomycetota bacterium]|nr:MAG: aldo/keto reductase [Planctomycetota bacterium]